MTKKMTAPKKVKTTPKEKKVEISQVQTIETAIDKEPTEYYTSIKHSCNLGDIIASLPAIRKFWEITQRKVIYLQQVNLPAAYYQGATHPTVDDKGNMVCINESMFDMVKPLIESQPYIHSFEKYNGQKFDLNFDVIRGTTDVGLPNFMIQSWLMFAFPDLDYDLSKTWIDLPEIENHPIKEQVDNKVILNFTERYRVDATKLEYYFLQGYAPDLIFAGTETEHFKFCTRWNLNIPRLQVSNFLELAYALKYSRFLMSNQSFLWNLATGLGTPRNLECCKWAANCQPFIGEHSKGYQYTIGAQYHFTKMYNETNKASFPRG